MVVFGLHLQEVEARIHIGPDAQFLTAGMPVLVNDVHIVVGGVEIGCVIGRYTVTNLVSVRFISLMPLISSSVIGSYVLSKSSIGLQNYMFFNARQAGGGLFFTFYSINY